MPVVIPNGGGSDVSSGELAAYNNAKEKQSGDQTAQDQQVVAQVEQKIAGIAAGWTDTGGNGGIQAAVALEVAARVGALEGNRLQAINQYAGEASGGTVKARRAQAEMHAADSKFLTEMLREVLELRERVNAAGIP